MIMKMVYIVNCMIFIDKIYFFIYDCYNGLFVLFFFMILLNCFLFKKLKGVFNFFLNYIDFYVSREIIIFSKIVNNRL